MPIRSKRSTSSASSSDAPALKSSTSPTSKLPALSRLTPLLSSPPQPSGAADEDDVVIKLVLGCCGCTPEDESVPACRGSFLLLLIFLKAAMDSSASSSAINRSSSAMAICAEEGRLVWALGFISFGFIAGDGRAARAPAVQGPSDATFLFVVPLFRTGLLSSSTSIAAAISVLCTSILLFLCSEAPKNSSSEPRRLATSERGGRSLATDETPPLVEKPQACSCASISLSIWRLAVEELLVPPVADGLLLLAWVCSALRGSCSGR
mmetsp:Transcript_15515/g.38441  ORF Transcript_15515/g.38441 Transcript_15515/m.38441 type:complete len:265 (+) Transcript_15515:193-987(+)